MFTKEPLHRNILILTNYKKQGKDKCALLGTRAPKSARCIPRRVGT